MREVRGCAAARGAPGGVVQDLGAVDLTSPRTLRGGARRVVRLVIGRRGGEAKGDQRSPVFSGESHYVSKPTAEDVEMKAASLVPCGSFSWFYFWERITKVPGAETPRAAALGSETSQCYLL